MALPPNTFVRVDEDGALARYSEFIKTCHNMNIIFQTTGGETSSLNCKSESPNFSRDSNASIIFVVARPLIM